MSLQIDPALLRSLDDGATLPASWYSDGDVFAAEKKRIFNRSWQYVGHIASVAKSGDFFTTRLGEVPVVVVRDEDGTLRAFANVCRHRGSEVVLDGAGNRKTLQCHYHGWTYNLDGTLRSAPRANEPACFRKEEISLVPLALE